MHGWPGDRYDFRSLTPLLATHATIVTPDLRGFGESDRHLSAGPDAYSASAQAKSVLGVIDELGLGSPVLAGYDVGSRVAQAIAKEHPDKVKALVISPPLPGVGQWIFDVASQSEFWYQPFHQSPLIEALLDGRRDAVHAYLEYFWQHWSGRHYKPESDQLERLAALYARPGAFVSSISYYRAGAGTVAQSVAEQTPTPQQRIPVRTVVIWPGGDALFPVQWSDRIEEFFSDVTVRHAEEAGHFTPLEAPDLFAAAILDAVGA
jgi:pimeloyl-ACP methyl ester carboxylesterase